MGDSVGDAKVNEVVVLSPIELLCRTCADCVCCIVAPRAIAKLSKERTVVGDVSE